ncbi:MAG: hypothetical protein ACOYLB_06730 [Phototrophicaceae bacterium]
MPARERLNQDLQGEDKLGILLMVQMGGVPEELQLMIQTVTVDKVNQTLQEGNAYIVRVLGVREHRVSLGMFRSMFWASDHPILYHHNSPEWQLSFEGMPSDVNALMIDLQATYGATFGPWRDIVQDLNHDMPLSNLLQQGKGILGTFPQPLAERFINVLAHHGIQSGYVEVHAAPEPDTKMKGFKDQLSVLGIDDSYFIAYSFMVDNLKGKEK